MGSAAYDVAVIGGGIVGMATAMKLTAGRAVSAVVLEAEDRLAAHQTGNNSGVIHSGIYYKPGSLKARNCVRGRQELYRFCQEHGIRHERCGKVIVAVHAGERERLDELERRGAANGIDGIRRLSAAEIRDHEPHVTGVAGLWIPVTGIVRYTEVTDAMARVVKANGGDIWTNCRVTAVREDSAGMILATPRGEVRCRHLINCGGLRCDEIARMCGVEPGLQILPFRGEYYQLVAKSRYLVRNLVYPVPDPRFPFLGVHFTRMIDGGVEAGPNAVLALKREGYRWCDISIRDSLKMATYRGFWKMALRYGKTGLGEVYRSLHKSAFVRALQRLIPELRPEDLTAGGAGVRAQAVDPSGTLVDDFRIIETDRAIHVLNAPSPAATASLSIGQTIAGTAVKRFGIACNVVSSVD
jgi:L-2-hydroxyglutarate oxidase